MANKEQLEKYITFRSNCLINSDCAFAAANLLKDQKANHIAYHLLLLALEEIGKIFVGYQEIVNNRNNGPEEVNYGFEDHIKKLFWAIWGPSFGNEIITKKQWEENQKLASTLHKKRIDSLYTNITDSSSGSEKVKAEELDRLFEYTEARLIAAKSDADRPFIENGNPDYEWFYGQTKNSERLNFILGVESQQKLLEFGNFKLWTAWLRELFARQDQSLSELAEKEINRKANNETQQVTPKWKIKIRISTPSHTIRKSVLDKFNNEKDVIKLIKGGENHILYFEILLGSDVTVHTLWPHGWALSKMYVAALNIATNGFFYWNSILDTEKYYENIWDLEHDKQLKLVPTSGLQLNWEQRKTVLNENHLHLTRIVFTYHLQLRDRPILKAFDLYLAGLALLAKCDIHSRFEVLIFTDFFSALKISVISSLQLDSAVDLIETTYQHLKKMVNTKSEFIRIMNIGVSLENGDRTIGKNITLLDIMLIKQYCGSYLLTLAIRKLHNNPNLSMFIEEDDNYS